MRVKNLWIWVAVLAIAASAAVKTAPKESSGWTFSGKVGVTGGNNQSVGMQGGLIAEYAISNRLSWRTDLDFNVADLSQMEDLGLAVPTNLLYYPLGSQNELCPYLGPGLNVTVPVNADLQAGFNGIIGARLQRAGKSALGIEGRYTVADIGSASKGTWTVSLTGSWNFSLQK